jgi:hypothetical protein
MKSAAIALTLGLYRERNRVERLINQLKQFRRLATRYEKRADNYLGISFSFDLSSNGMASVLLGACISWSGCL